MKIKILILTLLLGNNLQAQQNQYQPTSADLDSIYNRVEKAQIEKFLSTKPELVDISEGTRDSIFLTLINNYRLSMGLNKLTYVNVLNSACKLHTNWMLQEQKVGHEETSNNIDGKQYQTFNDRIAKFDPNWLSNHTILFENCGAAKSSIGNDPTIQFKRITQESVYEIFNGWKASPGHNAAMLDKHIKYLGFYLGSKFNKKQNNYMVFGTLLVSN
jgi:uncharacterized protein YkwD